MKRAILILCLLVSATITHAQEKVNVEVQVEGILSRKGDIRISVFDSSESYMKNPVMALQVSLKETEGETFMIEGLPAGDYAIIVLHDENENGQLDFGGMGPVEGYGFSNNPSALYGPANFKDAVTSFNSDTLISVRLN